MSLPYSPSNDPQRPSQASNEKESHSARTPPPGADPRVWKWFVEIDTDESGGIDATELQAALVNGDWTKFDFETVKMLINMFDLDGTGTIGFSEFSGLWKYISDWQKMFRHFARSDSGFIKGSEFAEALHTFGYGLSSDLAALFEKKYGSGPKSQSGLSFDRFVRACVVVKQLTETFQRVDSDRDGWIQIDYDELLQIYLSVPM